MQSFYNRLQKVNRHISKWAIRQGVSCYRIYDKDVPEFPFCVDRYEHLLHVSEYQSRHRNNEEEHQLWLEACVETISKALSVPVEDIYLKQRRRLSRRDEQYEKLDNQSKRLVVNEGGLQFWTNLTDYLDTGLFLDHRPLRQIFKIEAKDNHVLNLFAYTGSFSVYAASGGAASVTTVDLSNTYLNWCKDNFLLNNINVEEKKERYSFLQMDVMTFLKNTPRKNFDLVFVDPPAFSNSKSMKGTWDTQRDHAAMLVLILSVIKPGGVIYFSNNLKNFVPEFERLKNCVINDISLKTIPEDFRNKTIHHCYKIVKDR